MDFLTLVRDPGKRKRVVPLGAVCLALALPAQALMVAVYSSKESPASIEELKALALGVKEDRDAAAPEGLTYIVADEAVLSAEFSVPEGASAYFWADQTFETTEGFRMDGNTAHFEADFPVEEALAKEALDVGVPEKVYPTEFRNATFAAGNLNLAYSVTKPGRVLIEAYGMNGQRVGSWRIHEAAGEHARSFGLSTVAKGPLFVRWTAGNTQAVRRAAPVSTQSK